MYTIIITDLREGTPDDERLQCFGTFINKEVAEKSAKEKLDQHQGESIDFIVTPIYFTSE